MLLKILALLAAVALAWLLLRRSSHRALADVAPPSLSVDQAAAILGLSSDANAAQIKDAHRRLIAANHPDRGGSDFLAQQINQARDVLMAAERTRR